MAEREREKEREKEKERKREREREREGGREGVIEREKREERKRVNSGSVMAAKCLLRISEWIGETPDLINAVSPDCMNTGLWVSISFRS